MPASRTPRGTPRRRGLFASVRARTTALAALVVAVTLSAGAFGLLATLEHSLNSNRDALSRARCVDLANQAEAGVLPPVLTDIGDDFVGQVVAGDGTVLAASSGLTGQEPITSVDDATTTPELRILRGVPDDSETEDFRVWVLRSQTDSGPVTVFVGASLESVSETVSSLRRALLIGVPLTLLVLAFGTRLLVGRALRPVEDIRTEVAAITDTGLDRRVPVPAAPDEIGRLADTMNGMLDRLEAASLRQREFVADASHELQSPLAAFRVQLEVALAHPDDVDWSALLRDLLEDSDRMERLVRDLLFLAREDSGSYTPHMMLIDLDVVVLDEVKRLAPRTHIEFDTSEVSAAALEGSPDDLARLVRNLLDNAASHADARVSVVLSMGEVHATLTICDDGPGIAAEDRERVFDRFARVEGHRRRSVDGADGGTGLGLSIARVIAERHYGSIRVEAGQGSGGRRGTGRGREAGRGACLVVELPLRPPRVGPPEVRENGLAGRSG